ncbi:MAG: cardiolipin synthase [Peptoniphilaceae bacterium]|nr:cardiolipin synthase [Peptoniphilaceae bacterium]MDD7383253.1 cardiolipin synthase [Peptoniphilaceae bacterium]MDY3737990.1 cardiolipin synthase [Peptoniphilaceae bacterium]
MPTLAVIYFTIFSNMWRLNIILALIVLFGNRKKPQTTFLRMIIVIILPIFGFILYLMFGQDFRKSKKFDVKKKKDDVIGKIVGIQERQIESGNFFKTHEELKEYYQLLNMNLESESSIISEGNSIKFFYDGKDKFDCLFEDIRNAKKSIDIEYYIFRRDDLGYKLLSLLTKKAKEGLNVRLLVDGFGGGTVLKPRDVRKFKKAGGKFSIFFPGIFGSIFNFRINYRDHRKIVIIDDEISYVGGFNVGKEYLGKDKKFGYWRDTHARIYGYATFGLKIRFLKDWYFASKDSLAEQNPEISQNIIQEKLEDIPIQVISSGPDTEEKNIKNTFLKMILNAKKEIIIQTPYFVPDSAIIDALKIALLSGVRVRILIPDKPDHMFIYWATTSYAGEIIDAGGEVYTYNNGFTHSKVVIVDDTVSCLGSANMDNRSFSLNFETNIIIYSKKVNASLKEQFEKDILNSSKITMADYEHRKIIVKIKEAFSILFSPLL